MNRLKRSTDRMFRAFVSDDGAAAVSFILTFPIFLTIIAVIVQLVLMVNARICVASAADAAARSAVTSLPDEHPENVRKAALLALAPLGPEAGVTVTADATAVADALQTMGVQLPETFAARYTYADAASDVSWTPRDDFARSAAREIEVTVNYQFPLTVPVAMRMIPASTAPVGGVKGRFWEVSGKSRVQTAHGRKAQADSDGWPR